MRPLTVALLQGDPSTVRAICASLCHHFNAIYAAENMEQLRQKIARERVHLAIVDMEMAGLSEVERLRRDFAGLCVICTHRLADDEMWTAALNAGAADMCASVDTRGILSAALRHTPPVGISFAA